MSDGIAAPQDAAPTPSRASAPAASVAAAQKGQQRPASAGRVSTKTQRSSSLKGGLLAENSCTTIHVAVRIRPLSAAEAVDPCNVQELAVQWQGDTLWTRAIDKYGFDSEYARPRIFSFDTVLPSVELGSPDYAAQEKVFEEIGVPVLENALEAYNGCLLAYGQTGAGKSYTVLGDSRRDNEGLLPRAVERLFEMVDARIRGAESTGSRLQATILASYLEIYQEKMFDLLGSTRAQELQVRVHPDLGPHVPHLTESLVLNVRDVGELLDFGAKNRAVGATAMNAHSSRSHAVFTINLRLSTTGAETKDHHSKIHFVDLAGTEKLKKTHALGAGLQEGIAINQSLSSLSRVIHSLASGDSSRSRPPFRESKLTLLLKDALSGNSKTVLIACISPARSNLEESVSTLEFAARCKLVRTNAKKNEQDKRSLIESLSAEKRKVEQQLENELEQRRQLMAELRREAEQSRQSRDLVNRMREEKVAVERRLKALEESTAAAAAPAVSIASVGDDDDGAGDGAISSPPGGGSAAAELQEKLAELRLLEAVELRRAAETQARELEVRRRVEEEGRIRGEREEELKRELTGLQSLSDSLALEKQDLEQRYQVQRRDRDQLLRELGIVSLSGADSAEAALEDSREAPRLMNLNPDPLLEGSLVYCLPRGDTRIGADQRRCRVWLTGLHVGEEVCLVTNEDGKRLTVRPLSGGLVRVNGVAVTEGAKELCDSDRLTIGRAHIFRVIVPCSRKRHQIERDEREFDRAMRELQECAEVDPRWQRSVDAAVLTVKRDLGTREANALLERARCASEAVAEGNAVLRSIPASWAAGVSHYELAVLLEAEGPPTVCVVARRSVQNDSAGAEKSASGGARISSAGIWEATRFVEERLPHMHQAAEQLRLRSLLGNAPRPGFLSPRPLEDARSPQASDWEANVWAEVSPAKVRDLSRVFGESASLDEALFEGAAKRRDGIGGDSDLSLPGVGVEISPLTRQGASGSTINGVAESEPLTPRRGSSTSESPLRAVVRAQMSRGGGVTPPRRGSTTPPRVTTPPRAITPPRAPRATTPPRTVTPTGARATTPPVGSRGSGSVTPRGSEARHPRTSGSAAEARSGGTLRRSSAAGGLTPRRNLTPRGSASGQHSQAATINGAIAELAAAASSLGPRPTLSNLCAQRRCSLPSSISTGGGGGQFAGHEAEDAPKICNVRVDQLFNERLGVHLRSDRLVVAGLDAPEVAELGWCLHDEIIAVNGRPVTSKQQFSESLADVCEFPIVFTVKRGGSTEDSCSSSHSSPLRQERREALTPRRGNH